MNVTTQIRFTETEANAVLYSSSLTHWHDSQMFGLVLDVTTKAKVFRAYNTLRCVGVKMSHMLTLSLS